MLVMWSMSTSAPALIVFALAVRRLLWRLRRHRALARRRLFRRPALGSIIGALYSGVAFGALLGSPVAGYAYDFFGSYTGAILAGAALCLVSFVITLLMPEPARWLARHRRPDAGPSAGDPRQRLAHRLLEAPRRIDHRQPAGRELARRDAVEPQFQASGLNAASVGDERATAASSLIGYQIA